jgi:5-methylphenazine-1-carboxylate 1-monooxygenase
MHAIIVGGGIGGLTTALALRRHGFEVTIYEQVAEIKALGVGINLLSHAVGILTDLGLGDALAATAIEAQEYVFMNRFGQEILADARGTKAGYRFPQYSIHRGALQMILLGAAQRVIGAAQIRTGLRCSGFTDEGNEVQVHFADRNGQHVTTQSADLLIACDGIHSAVRAQLYPKEGMPLWNGATMWRGVSIGAPFRTGASIIKAGWTAQKFVAYPISAREAAAGRAQINWICDLHTHDTNDTTLLAREDWNRVGRLEDFLPQFETWKFPFLDVPTIVRSAESVYEFPMVDRDPLPRWSHGRVTLLGDAAHPMVPISSNGASQAILDAEALAASLQKIPDPITALTDYESKRRPPTAEIVRMNRQQGPDVILDLVHERAPNGFSNIDEVISRTEIEAIVGRYKRAAGHQQTNATEPAKL